MGVQIQNEYYSILILLPRIGKEDCYDFDIFQNIILGGKNIQ